MTIRSSFAHTPSEDERVEDAIKLRTLVRRHVDREQLRHLRTPSKMPQSSDGLRAAYRKSDWCTSTDHIRLAWDCRGRPQVAEIGDLMQQSQDSAESSIGVSGKRYRRDVLAEKIVGRLNVRRDCLHRWNRRR